MSIREDERIYKGLFATGRCSELKVLNPQSKEVAVVISLEDAHKCKMCKDALSQRKGKCTEPWILGGEDSKYAASRKNICKTIWNTQFKAFHLQSTYTYTYLPTYIHSSLSILSIQDKTSIKLKCPALPQQNAPTATKNAIPILLPRNPRRKKKQRQRQSRLTPHDEYFATMTEFLNVKENQKFMGRKVIRGIKPIRTEDDDDDYE